MENEAAPSSAVPGDASDASAHDETSAGWRCRRCALRGGYRYRYPEDAEVYCSQCEEPLGAADRIATCLAILARAADATAKPLLDATEAASFLGTTLRGLYSLRSRGKLPPPVGPSSRLLYRREDLLNLRVRASSPRRNRR